jgi:hypothetical protein
MRGTYKQCRLPLQLEMCDCLATCLMARPASLSHASPVMMRIWLSSSGSSLSWQARLSSTNANSPPWLSRKPVRMDSDLIQKEQQQQQQQQQ